MFSQTAEYALRAAVFMAESPEQRRTTREIAVAMSIPLDYLSKVMQCLVRAGLVRAQRGKSGGFLLARASHQVSVLDIVNAVDPIRRISKCPLGLKQHRASLCPLHKKMDQTLASIERDFRETRLSDLIEKAAQAPELAATAVGGAHAK
jgi:Rrf2 family transcriptional regulator, nitric oxide-sensitive transcriptional repressor